MAEENLYGVKVEPLDYTDAKEGYVTTMTYHGAFITNSANQIIGRIRQWTVEAYQRDVQHIYELNGDTWGRPVDIVPGRTSGYTINIDRAEVWNNELEISLGYKSIWTDLLDQRKPFTIYEYLFRGDQLYLCWKYSGCWFTSKSSQGFSSDGDGIVSVSGNIMFVKRTLIGNPPAAVRADRGTLSPPA